MAAPAGHPSAPPAPLKTFFRVSLLRREDLAPARRLRPCPGHEPRGPRSGAMLRAASIAPAEGDARPPGGDRDIPVATWKASRQRKTAPDEASAILSTSFLGHRGLLDHIATSSPPSALGPVGRQTMPPQPAVRPAEQEGPPPARPVPRSESLISVKPSSPRKMACPPCSGPGPRAGHRLAGLSSVRSPRVGGGLGSRLRAPPPVMVKVRVRDLPGACANLVRLTSLGLSRRASPSW